MRLGYWFTFTQKVWFLIELVCSKVASFATVGLFSRKHKRANLKLLCLLVPGQRARGQAVGGRERVHHRCADPGEASAERMDPPTSRKVLTSRPPSTRHESPLPPDLQPGDLSLRGRHR